MRWGTMFWLRTSAREINQLVMSTVVRTGKTRLKLDSAYHCEP